MSGVTTNLADELRKALRDGMNEHADYMAQGGCKDYDEYSHLCGVIKGLAIAERELLDLLKIAEDA